MMTLFRFFLWLLRAMVFLGLFGLAIKNSGPVELRFFFGQAWTAPVAVVILAAFAIGAGIGLTAAIGVSRRNKNNQTR